VKAYLVTTLVIDFDGLGPEGIVTEMENVRYPNRCLSPSVQEITGFDIGPWDDDHPLNQRGTNVTDYLTSTLMPKD
jgi:hypothetical protein